MCVQWSQEFLCPTLLEKAMICHHVGAHCPGQEGHWGQPEPFSYPPLMHSENQEGPSPVPTPSLASSPCPFPVPTLPSGHHLQWV